ncbi:hypothetical protein TNCV_2887911 [Trichonephila clavipes]|nr:hypothetical protein TNCV_2887911 [Trichonephila clavipes]
MECDAEDCGFQMLNNDEIATSVQEESDPVDDETEEDEDNNNSKSSKGNIQIRYILALMGFYCFFVLSALRLNISIGIVAMVDWSAIKKDLPSEVVKEECSYNDTDLVRKAKEVSSKE